jgi:glyoxylase-like metal-dependent hydrolase (beta-lactamase superfamily II)
MLVGPGIELVLAPNPSVMTGRGTNTYVFGDDSVAVMDPGPNMPEHLEAILNEVGTRTVSAIIVTHGHSDHLPAAYPLARKTGAPIYGHEQLPGVTSALRDGEILEIAGRGLRALDTPGHTRDSLSFVVEDERLLFAGDVVAGEGTVVVGRERGDLAMYLDSLQRLLNQPVDTILPGHGPSVASGRDLLQQYLYHRLGREREILEGLHDGARSIDELVERIYPGLDERLRKAAGGNVQAHLWKLEDEHRAALESDNSWRLIPNS